MLEMVRLLTSVKEAVTLRICGTCKFSSRRLSSIKIQRLARRVHSYQRHLTNLDLARRYAKPLKNEKTLCRKEKVMVGLLDKACAFWKP